MLVQARMGHQDHDVPNLISNEILRATNFKNPADPLDKVFIEAAAKFAVVDEEVSNIHLVNTPRRPLLACNRMRLHGF